MNANKNLICKFALIRVYSRLQNGSAVPLQQIHGQRFERDGLAAENFKRVKSAAGELLRNLFRFLQPDNGGVGRFPGGGVLARSLAEPLAGLRDIEDVVDDLKRQADVVTELAQRL